MLLLLAVALAVGVLMVLWPTLPVQAQSESTDNDSGDAPAQGESIEIDTGDEPQPTENHLISFSDDELPEDYEKLITDRGGRVEAAHPQIGVAVASGLNEAAADSLRSTDGIKSVDRDMKREWIDPREMDTAEVTAEEAPAEEGTAAEVEQESSNNPQIAGFYARQWNLRAIKANKAWEAGKLGSSNVTVAILDSGIDPNLHTDLRGRVDSIENGPQSKSFVPTKDKPEKNYTSDETIRKDKAQFPNTPPQWADLGSHGTHVAATVSSNANAAAGVTSKVNLQAVKVLDRFGDGTDSAVLAGILYAADSGADVINMSLGSHFSKSAAQSRGGGVLPAYNRAINYAYERGTTIVVSAGNEGLKLNDGSDLYKAFCESPHVVCVSATGPTSSGVKNGTLYFNEIDTKAPYSNYGSPITVAAPGGTGTPASDLSNREGFVRAACSRTSVTIPLCRTGNFVLAENGTSMAAPHTSGLAALLVEKIGKDQPSEVAAAIRQSAEDLGASSEDAYYGHGRINVAKALGLEQRKPQ